MDLSNMGNYSAAISILVLIVTLTILKPLRQEISAANQQNKLYNENFDKRIDSLIKSIDRLTDKLDAQRGEVNELRERVAKVESSASSAHKRIDDIKNRGGQDVVR